MAYLYWHSNVLRLPSATRTIVTHKNNLHGTLITHGYQNVRNNELEVAGGKDECWFSVGHFLIDPNTPGGTEIFWEIVMCAGDNFEKTKGIVNDVVALSNLINKWD